MPLSCHAAMNKMKKDVDYVFALAGNPNVGKSTLFNHLTGMGVMTANYPGKTVELNIADTTFADHKIGIIDLPGTYAIGGVSEDQWVARQGVLDCRPNVIIAIIDATNLARNLYMVLQFLDLGFPMVVAVNLTDQAEKKGLITDTEKLSSLLGVPTVSTVASMGQGLEELMETALRVAKQGSPLKPKVKYNQDIERFVVNIEKLLSSPRIGSLPFGLSPRAVAVLLLEKDIEFTKIVSDIPTGTEIVAEADRLAILLQKIHGETAPLVIARERFGLAGLVAAESQQIGTEKISLTDKLWSYTTAPFSGLLIFALVMTSTFALLFSLGSLLATAFSGFWAVYISPVIDQAIFALVGHGVLEKTLIWGFDAGIEATLGVGIPYVLTFYFLLAILEDTGYLNSIAFLTDRIMHRFGLHGRAIIPLVSGAGCNVPAIIGTRVLTSSRERLVASTLITLVPCSARTAVIMGAMAFIGGWQPAVAIFLMVMFLIIFVGISLNKILPYEPSGLVMEMFPFRAPSLLAISKKTWFRFRYFVVSAMPIVFIGSLVLGALYETGYIWSLSAPLSPLVEGWLGLPAVAGLTLIFAVLRKELALQLLVTLAIVKYGPEAKNLLNFMNPNQLFVYALVNTIYIPCVATIAVLAKELSWKKALSISAFTIALAVLIGGIAMRVLSL